MLSILLLLLLCLVRFVPLLFGLQTLVVLGGSMEPTLHAGDLVYIKACDPREIEVGDIITFGSSGGVPATHRVIGIQKDQNTFLTKGDANRSNDNPIPFDRLMGRVVFSIPCVGRMVAVLKGGYGLLVVVGLIAVLTLHTLLTLLRKSSLTKSHKCSQTDIWEEDE